MLHHPQAADYRVRTAPATFRRFGRLPEPPSAPESDPHRSLKSRNDEDKYSDDEIPRRRKCERGDRMKPARCTKQSRTEIDDHPPDKKRYRVDQPFRTARPMDSASDTEDERQQGGPADEREICLIERREEKSRATRQDEKRTRRDRTPHVWIQGFILARGGDVDSRLPLRSTRGQVDVAPHSRRTSYRDPRSTAGSARTKRGAPCPACGEPMKPS